MGIASRPQLSPRAAELIRTPSNEVFVSAASLFEIAIKKKIGKLVTTRSAAEIVQEMTRVLAFQLLPILPHHLDAYESIPLYDDHRDPFDRLLVASAFTDQLTLISDDGKFERYVPFITLVR